MNVSLTGAPGVRGAARRLPSAVRALPLEDWVAFCLLTCVFATVAWSLQLADWGGSPSVLPTLVVASVAGLVFARSGVAWPLGHVVSVPFGFAMVMWQATLRAEGTNVVGRGFDVWGRFGEWLEAARLGGVSVDTLPFTLLLLSAAWVVGYASAWPLFRWRSPWVAILLPGVSILTSLSYRMHRFEYTFFFFVVAAFALFLYATGARRVARWRASGTPFPASIRWLTVRDALLVGPAVVVLAAFLPLWEPRPVAVGRAWEAVQSPFAPLKDPASRLLSGIMGRDTGPLGAFNTTLPFRGAINLSEQALMRVWSSYPTYHVGRLYETYTSGGWVNGPTEERLLGVRAGAREADPPYERLEPVRQMVEPLFDAASVLPGGLLVGVDRAVQVEVLEPMEFDIGLGPEGLDPSLPEDVRAFGEQVREVFPAEGPPPGNTRRLLASLPSAGLVWRASLGRDGRLLALAVRRAGVEPEQQVSVRFDVPVAAMQPYSMTTWVSTATDAELMEAGEDYPAWVTDRYLQLPETLPERVRTLAEDLVERAGAETPFEKTMALAEFLGSQVYSQEIAGPERGEDGVDYFLFETVKEPCPSDNRGCDAKKAKGYSQYFGSALTVMLRSVGVPARMVAGFGPGEFTTPSGAYVVRGSDRHGWSQVFFPGYGWIDVEATPGASQPTRGVPTPSLAPPRPALGTPPGGEDQTLFEEDLAALEELLRQARMRGLLPQEEEAGGWPVAPVAGGLSGVAGAIVAGVLVWVWGLRGLRPAERAYARVVRLGSLVGLGRPAHYTPREYGALLSDAMPSSSREVGGIVARYEAQVYGRAESGGDDAGELERMWRRVRGAMLGWRLRNLLGVRTVPGPVAPVRSPE